MKLFCDPCPSTRSAGCKVALCANGVGNRRTRKFPRSATQRFPPASSASPTGWQRLLAFGLVAVAEGVEREETRALLLEAGCDLAQGNLFGAPLAPEALREWWAGHARRP